jgi:hypothetical protein
MAKGPAKPKKVKQATGPAGKTTSKNAAASSSKKMASPRAAQTGRKSVKQKPSQKSAKKKTPAARTTSRRATTKAAGAAPAPTPYSFPPPVSPRPELLPLSDPNWTWEGFQAFCLDLVSRLPTTKKAGKNHHFGKQGDAQDGIDLIADIRNGEHWGFQCKKEKRFTEAGTQKAIKVTTYKADKFIILLSIDATVAVRKVMRRRKKWDVWDVRDISQRVRQLPLDDARQLLDHHFGPAWRKAFLGVSAANTFPSAEGFFGPFLNGSKLFNHTWALIGRAGYLEALHGFVGSDQQRVAVFLGRGGIGKTKLLHAFSQEFESRHSEYNLYFLADGLPVTQDSLDDLPSAPCVVVVDDAHRRSEDVAALLALAQQRAHPLKVLLSARPQGADHLNSLLNRAGVDERQMARIGTISDLSREETKELARQALGAEHAHLSDRLTAATRDCPLVTVVGGQLLARSAVEPMLLDQHDEFRQAVLTKFEDILIGQIGDLIEPTLCRRLLAVLAAVSPIRPENEQLQGAAATFLGVKASVVAEAVNILEQHGILLRRGYSLRIAPDVLADHVLHKACLTTQGRLTGFAQQVYDQFVPICSTQVLRNLAELDWRVQQATGEQTDLLASIWHNIEDRFREAPHSLRGQILDALKDIAYFQPGRMLDLVQYAMRNPATAPEDERLARFHQFDHAGVLQRLPDLLKLISRTLEYLPCCADLLWELGRDEDRIGFVAGHEAAMSVLIDMARYHLDKPFAVNHAVVAAVRRWLREPDAHDHRNSPLDVLDPLFEKTGHTSYSEGYQIAIRAFKLGPDEVAALRNDALGVVRECAFSANTRVALRALGSLDHAMCGPLPLFDMTISKEDRAQWVPEQLTIIGILCELTRGTNNPLIHLRVLEALHWHTRYGLDDVKQQAKDASAAVPDTFDLRLTRSLAQGHGTRDLPEDEEVTADALLRNHERQVERRRALAREYWQQHPDGTGCMADLSGRLLAIQATGRAVHPCQFLDMMLEVQPSRAVDFCEAVLHDPDSPLSRCFGRFLAHVRGANVERAVALAEQVLESGNVLLCRALADVYGRAVFESGEARTDDLVVLRRLLGHADVGVRVISVDAFRRLGRSHPGTAIALARFVEFGAETDLADAVCATIHAQFGIPPDLLSDEDITTILKKLEAVNRLHHHVQEFLAMASARRPREVVELLLVRVERGDAQYDSDFEPLPYLGLHHGLGGLADADDYEAILVQIRDRAVRADGRGRFWITKLFKEVSFGYGPRCLSVLGEWINSGDPARIEAATALLREAPAAFVFDQFDFVSNTISRALVAGDECRQAVSGNLFACAVYHGRERVGGGPFPQDVTLRDKATDAMLKTPTGSPQHRFYESLFKRADANIRDSKARDEEMEN